MTNPYTRVPTPCRRRHARTRSSPDERSAERKPIGDIGPDLRQRRMGVGVKRAPVCADRRKPRATGVRTRW